MIGSVQSKHQEVCLFKSWKFGDLNAYNKLVTSLYSSIINKK